MSPDMQPGRAEEAGMIVLWLGFAGLLPFIVLAGGLWLAPVAWQVTLLTLLLHYSAVILAFTGAIHWGLSMRADTITHRQHYALSVMPALLAWGLLSLPPALALLGFMCGFVAIYTIDVRAIRLGLAPDWYGQLRWPLTLVVCGCLLAALWSMLS